MTEMEIEIIDIKDTDEETESDDESYKYSSDSDESDDEKEDEKEDESDEESDIDACLSFSTSVTKDVHTLEHLEKDLMDFIKNSNKEISNNFIVINNLLIKKNVGDQELDDVERIYENLRKCRISNETRIKEISEHFSKYILTERDILNYIKTHFKMN